MIDLDDFIDGENLPKINDEKQSGITEKRNASNKINPQTKLLDLAHIKITKIDPQIREEIQSLLTQSEQDLIMIQQLIKKL